MVVNKIFVIENSGSTTPTISGDSCVIIANIIEGCDNDNFIRLSSADTFTNKGIIVNGNITPNITNVSDIGTPFKRFRSISSISGEVITWKVTSTVITPEIDLGFDSDSIHRIINANNSIIQDDELLGGVY